MKSSDEIKKAMLHCSPVSCRSNDCPYKDDTPKYEGDMPVCRMKLWHDMGCLIQQLEKERDALIGQARENDVCVLCKHKDVPCDAEPCVSCCAGGLRFEWRGVQKEG